MLPLSSLAVGIAFPPQQDARILNVGILLPATSPRAEQLWQCLLGYSDEQTQLVRAESAEEVEQMVAARVWECGYLIAEDLDSRIEEGRYDRMVTRVVSPSSIVLFTGWMVTSALLEVCAPSIAADYLIENDLSPKDRATLVAEAEASFHSAAVMEVEVRQMQGGGGDGSVVGASGAVTGASVARGLLALLLMMFSCICAARQIDDASSGFFSRSGPMLHPAQLFLPAYAAPMLLSLLAGTASLAILLLIYPSGYAGLLREGACLLCYLIYLMAFAFVLAALLRRSGPIIAALPFLLVACLLLCPILFDLSAVLPAGRFIAALLPPTLYLRAVGGDNSALLAMAAASPALLVAGVLLQWRRRHSPVAS